MRKNLISSIVLAAGFSFSASMVPHNAQAEAQAATVNMQLVKGQIGELTILQDTSLIKPGPNQQMSIVRTLKKGSAYHVYSVTNFSSGTYYGVGAGYFVKASSLVKYITPSTRTTAVPNEPLVNPVTDKDSYITGQAEINSTVYIKTSGKTYTQALKTTSSFKIAIPPQNAGTIVSVYVVNSLGQSSSQVTLKVLDKITTEYPTINQLTDKDFTISGTTEPGATVFISKNSVHIASFKADQTGYYFMPIPLQTPGTVFSVYAQDSVNNWSHTTEATVTAQARNAQINFNAPIVKQMPELPRGCEVTSLTMLLNYMGIQVDKMTLAQQIKKDPTPYDVVDGKIYFGNPNVGFVGSLYTLNQRGYGVYNQPIEALARTYVPNRIVNLTGQSFDAVLDYVSLRHPVWVITSYAYIPSQDWETYYTPQGPIQVTDWEHSVLITGYDANYVYFNDPLSGTNKRKPINDVKAGWQQLGSQAISYF